MEAAAGVDRVAGPHRRLDAGPPGMAGAVIEARNVTVCVPTIPGREQLLARALASVDAQTARPRRILVVADTERRGAAWTRNRLLRQVRTSWVAWLDDDDE